jgi:hypothetical protein
MENVSVDGKCECGRYNLSVEQKYECVQKLLECVVCEFECAYVECAVGR